MLVPVKFDSVKEAIERAEEDASKIAQKAHSGKDALQKLDRISRASIQKQVELKLVGEPSKFAKMYLAYLCKRVGEKMEDKKTLSEDEADHFMMKTLAWCPPDSKFQKLL